MSDTDNDTSSNLLGRFGKHISSGYHSIAPCDRTISIFYFTRK